MKFLVIKCYTNMCRVSRPSMIVFSKKKFCCKSFKQNIVQVYMPTMDDSNDGAVCKQPERVISNVSRKDI